MEKSMNMTINRLPAITWNRLKMNEAFVPDVKIPVAGTYEEQLGYLHFDSRAIDE